MAQIATGRKTTPLMRKLAAERGMTPREMVFKEVMRGPYMRDAADRLGITLPTLYDWVNRLGIDRDSLDAAEVPA